MTRRLLLGMGYFAVGLAAGVLGHYTLYRIGLPLEPFIYVAF